MASYFTQYTGGEGGSRRKKEGVLEIYSLYLAFFWEVVNLVLNIFIDGVQDKNSWGGAPGKLYSCCQISLRL